MHRLNGWYRLWVFISVLYALIAIAVVYSSFPSRSEVAFNEVLPYLSDRSLTLIVKEQEWKEFEVDGQRISVPAALDLTAEREFAQDYLQAQRRALSVKQLKHVALAFAWWAVPCLTLLALGLGIAWVRRGFARQAP